MPYRFNPFTGTLDIVEKSISSTFRYTGFSKDIDFPDLWYLQDTDGEFITDEHGDKIFTGCPGNPLLDSNGEEITDSDGNAILDSDGLPHGIGGYASPYLLDTDGGILLDSDDNPILDSDWRNRIVSGVATQLDSLEQSIQYVTIQAKWTNLGYIWVAQDRTPLIKLRAGSIYTRFTNDIRSVYIIGNAGEGVNYEYGSNTDIFLTTPGGDFVTTPGGDQIG